MSDTVPNNVSNHVAQSQHHFVHLDLDAVLTDRQQALQTWLSRHIDGDYDIHTLQGDASFRGYHRIVLADNAILTTSTLKKSAFMLPSGQQSVLVMDAPPDKESVAQFIQVAQLLAPVVNVPDILAEDKQQGFLLLQDFGKTEFAHLLINGTDKKIDLLYHQAMDSLIRLQSLNIEQAGLPLYDADMLSKEMALFADWFLPYVGIELTENNFNHATTSNSMPSQCWQQLVQQIIIEIDEQPKVVVHRDYHSRNLMQDESQSKIDSQNSLLGIIDFQDAVIGSYVYDLVSLLRDAYVHWSKLQINAWTTDFWHMLQATNRPLTSKKRAVTTFEQYQKDIMTMGIQRHLKVLGIFVRLAQRDGKSRYLADIPKVMDDLLFELNWLANMDTQDKYPDQQSQKTQQVAQAFLVWLQKQVLPAYQQKFLSNRSV